MVLFIEYVIISLKSVDEILWCDHSNETSTFTWHHLLDIKGVRATCFCASLLRTLFIAQYHATSCIERAR